MTGILTLGTLAFLLVTTAHGVRAQGAQHLDDALTAAITRLHAGREGARIALADPEAILPRDVTLSASKKLRALLVSGGDASDTAEATYYIRGAKVGRDTVRFTVHTRYNKDGHRWFNGRTVWLTREGTGWVVVRVRRRGMS